jgi:hypothetical protein
MDEAEAECKQLIDGNSAHKKRRHYATLAFQDCSNSKGGFDPVAVRMKRVLADAGPYLLT